MQHLAAHNQYTGGHPRYGYRVLAGGSLEELAPEQTTRATARALRSQGLSLREIGRTLEQTGMVSRTGRSFEAAQIARMLG
jgi:hypothetical protein